MVASGFSEVLFPCSYLATRVGAQHGPKALRRVDRGRRSGLVLPHARAILSDVPRRIDGSCFRGRPPDKSRYEPDAKQGVPRTGFALVRLSVCGFVCACAFVFVCVCVSSFVLR